MEIIPATIEDQRHAGYRIVAKIGKKKR